jgi:hypothetical protein
MIYHCPDCGCRGSVAGGYCTVCGSTKIPNRVRRNHAERQAYACRRMSAAVDRVILGDVGAKLWAEAWAVAAGLRTIIKTSWPGAGKPGQD